MKPAPVMRAKKNSFRSASMRVSGRLRDRKTGLCLRSTAFPAKLKLVPYGLEHVNLPSSLLTSLGPGTGLLASES